MKKIIYLLFSILFSLFLISCSKKNLTYSNNEHNKIYSRQLEMEYPAVNQEEANDISASVSESYAFSSPVVDARFSSPTDLKADRTSELKMAIEEVKLAKSKAEKIQILQKTISAKVGAKKMARIVDKLHNTNETVLSGGQIITGIIVGIIGLVLIGIAGSTGAPGLVYLAGIILFVAAVILILMGIF